MKHKKLLISLTVILLLLASLTVTAGAFGYLDLGFSKSGGRIYVNGAEFSGTLKEAVTLAGGGGTVEIEGTVYTTPVGDPSRSNEPILHDITIKGRDFSAAIVLKSGYYGDIYNKTDVLTVAGANVAIRDLTIDGGFRIDFPLRIFAWAENVSVENVTARRGTRGAVNILSDKNISLKNVRADDGAQSGFYLDGGLDGAGISFLDCSTRGNFRTGVLVRNCYGAVENLDLSGITCFENTFSIEDRIGGGINNNGIAYPMSILLPPKNKDGEPIKTDAAAYFNVERQYRHYRYGISPAEYAGAKAFIDAERYGMNTRFYYLDESVAASNRTEIETVILTETNVFPKIQSFFARLFHTVKNFLS
ncbi:MAG: hypothetical protein LBT20_04765 [Clostridiales bacterium]|jgi:hypothetical protein|nr:hypothetical protein [Clostridiales bacterium]